MLSSQDACMGTADRVLCYSMLRYAILCFAVLVGLLLLRLAFLLLALQGPLVVGLRFITVGHYESEISMLRDDHLVVSSDHANGLHLVLVYTVTESAYERREIRNDLNELTSGGSNKSLVNLVALLYKDSTR